MNITSSQYQTHVEISKELNMNSGFVSVREPFKEDFEKLRQEAKDRDINLSNAKDFLNSLSKEELNTLQKYSGLADEINVGKLNDEGAYNLLLEHYEKFDFNNDGLVSDGISQTTTLIPVNMPNDEKRALVKTLNEMDEKDSFLMRGMLTLPKFTYINGEFVASYNTPQNHETIMQRVEETINPKPPAYSSEELKDTFRTFKELFEKNYEEIKNQDNQVKNNLEVNSNIFKAKLENTN